LKLIDDRMEKTGFFYIRFMDNWIVLSSNQWKLKKTTLIVNQTFNELKVKKHPDKTFIGRVAKKLDFLEYSFEHKGLSVAPNTLVNFIDRMCCERYQMNLNFVINTIVCNCFFNMISY
jgi:hypothetical protein